MMMHWLVATAILAAVLPVGLDNGNLLGKLAGKHRLVLIFGDAMNEAIADQADRIHARQAEADDRDMMVLTVVGGIVSDGQIMGGLPTANAMRRQFRIEEGAPFTVILVGKDGQEKLRDSQPVAADALFDLIDTMPMRRKEVREGEAN